mgnify:CR=1 FL=1
MIYLWCFCTAFSITYIAVGIRERDLATISLGVILVTVFLALVVR